MLLDLNQLAAGHAYFRMGAFEVSPDHRLLAYSVDTSGAESFTIFLKDLATGELLPETIERTSTAAAWANDSRTLFYIVLDDARRPSRLYRHRVGSNPVEDVLVHFEPDDAFFLDINRTRSRRFLVLDLASHSTSEVRYASADRPEDSFRVVEPRRHGIEYGVAHHGDRFYIVTNDDAPNFRLVSAPVDDPGRANWIGGPALPARRSSSTRRRRSGTTWWSGSGRTGSGGSGCWSSTAARSTWSPSPSRSTPCGRTRTRSSTPRCSASATPRWSRRTRWWTTTWRRGPGRCGSRPRCWAATIRRSYRSERLFAAAPDGTRVPVSLVYRLPLERDGRRPLLLQGYGSYGYSFDPAFSSNR